MDSLSLTVAAFASILTTGDFLWRALSGCTRS
jgi:hypothetical protein